MIIQTAPPGTPRLAVMMHEHTALCAQFARAFGNDRFESLSPLDLMIYVIGHHDAGWTEFDRDPVTDEKTGLPYNLVETPAEHITITSRLSPDFNERQHPYCGLISSMHSWGLYNGRYGLSNLVLIDRIPQHDRPLAARMLDGELSRQKKLKEEIGKDSRASGWLDEKKIFQNYKQLQFLDTLALYFNRVHPDARGDSVRHRIRTLGREQRGIERRVDLMPQLGDILDAGDPFVAVPCDGLAAEADLDRAVLEQVEARSRSGSHCTRTPVRR